MNFSSTSGAQLRNFKNTQNFVEVEGPASAVCYKLKLTVFLKTTANGNLEFTKLIRASVMVSRVFKLLNIYFNAQTDFHSALSYDIYSLADD